MKEKSIEVSGYGLFLMSIEIFEDFLKKRKIKTKKLNSFFDKDNDVFQESLKEGVWLPIAKIDSIEYTIMLSDKDSTYDNTWEEVFSLNNFNLTVGASNSVWIGSLDSLNNWNPEKDYEQESISYQTLDGETLFNAHKFSVASGTYKVTIKGYKKSNEKYGFMYVLEKTQLSNNVSDPLACNFNVVEM